MNFPDSANFADNIGQNKAEVSKYKLLQTNPNSNIEAHSVNIGESNINLLNTSSIVIDTTDNWQTSKFIN